MLSLWGCHYFATKLNSRVTWRFTQMNTLVPGEDGENIDPELLEKVRELLSSLDDNGPNVDPELLSKAILICRAEKQRSVALLQRRLCLGYTVASKLIDEIKDHGLDGQPPS